jgi:hypothetical protein
VYKVQYRVRVEPGEGRARVVEGEWVDEGSIATVRVESARFGFPVQTVLDRFHAEGGRIVEQNPAAGWARVLVNSPTTVYVLWRKDYTILYALTAVLAAAAVGVALLIVTKGLPALTGRAAAAAARKREIEVKPVAPPTAVQPETAAAQPAGEGTQVMDLKYLESELAKLVEEAGKYREYLEKLEAAKAEGKISETAYEKLKKEYVEKLSQLEKRIKEIEDIKKKLS